jgi:hypothetical protein
VERFSFETRRRCKEFDLDFVKKTAMLTIKSQGSNKQKQIVQNQSASAVQRRIVSPYLYDAVPTGTKPAGIRDLTAIFQKYIKKRTSAMSIRP